MRGLNKILIGLTVVIAFFSFIFSAYYYNWLPVKNIVLQPMREDQKKSFEQIQPEISKMASQLMGSNLFKVDLKSLVANLESNKQIKEARVFRRLPDQLKVEVLLHEPMAILLTQNNKLIPISKAGTLLNEIALKDYPDLPLLRGKEFERDGEQREQALLVFNSLPKTGSVTSKNISELYKTKKDGYVLVLKNTGTEVLLGEDQFDKKALAVEKVLKYMDEERLKGRVIDARMLKKVVVKLY